MIEKLDVNKIRAYISVIGEPTVPEEKKAMEIWKGMCKYLPPRMCLLLTEVKTEKMIKSYGFDELGYPEGFPKDKDAFLNIHHENHKELVKFQSYAFFKALVDYPELVGENKFILSATKGLYDINRKPWLIHQTSTTLQFDEKGMVSRYVSAYRIVKEYEGEPFLSDIAFKPKYNKEGQEVRKKIKSLRMNMLPGLGFTERQIKVIEMMSLGTIDSKKIATELGISEKTLSHHRSNILKTAKVIFPENNFNTASDVVNYLKEQKMV
jgi:DNA-binding CsgD family transcriptional regulator